MRALDPPVFAYSTDACPFLDRVAAFCGDTLRGCHVAVSR